MCEGREWASRKGGGCAWVEVGGREGSINVITRPIAGIISFKTLQLSSGKSSFKNLAHRPNQEVVASFQIDPQSRGPQGLSRPFSGGPGDNYRG